MRYRSPADLEKDMAELRAEGTTFHKFSDVVDIVGTGKFSEMPQGKKYTKVHRLTATELVKKGYAKMAS